jgi:hypothetical protein
MPKRISTDDHNPPPGKRTGEGIRSLLPFLRRALLLKTNPEPELGSKKTHTGDDDDPSQGEETRPEKPQEK